MCMGLHRIRIIKIKKIILCLLLLLFPAGCSQNDTSDKLIDHYDELNISMKHYFDEKDLPTYSGKYIEVKVKKIIRFDYNGNIIYVYDLLIAPIYNQKTRINSIKLSSIEYGKDVEKFYYDLNYVYGKLGNDIYNRKTIDKIVGLEYEFFLDDNSVLYGYSLSDEQYQSCLTNICMTVNINGYKDKIYLSNLTITDYTDEDKNNRVISYIVETNKAYGTLHAYADPSEFED